MLANYKILTVTHRQTPLKAIGSFVVPHTDDNELQQKLLGLQEELGIEELMYLATCNRVLYFFYDGNSSEEQDVTTFFQAIQPELAADFIQENVQSFCGEKAIDHLFKVAASVDSLVVGEREILRQLRQAYDRSREWGLTGDHLRIAMQQAVLAAKEVYTSTRLGEKSVSVVSLAVKEMLKTGLPKDARILMIGAGQTNMLVAKFLKKYGFENVTVFNRTLARAEQLAAKFQNAAFPLADLENYGMMKKSTLILDFGNMTMYAPSTAEIAPLAPTMGILLSILK